MLFQAIGAEYTFGQALRLLGMRGKKDAVKLLTTKLGERYGGEATLYYKGRAALAEAVRLATGGEGSVAVSAFTCYSVPQAVWAAGVQVVYVDVREEDLQFGASELAAALKKHPDIKAVIVQNTLGIPAEMAAIEAAARKQGIVIIEDLAHTVGATYDDGREVGTVGDLTMLSFGRDKAIDTVNGGALIIRNRDFGLDRRPNALPNRLQRLRDRLYPLIAVKTRMLYRIGLGKYFLAGVYKLGLAVRSADGDVDVTQRLPRWHAQRAMAAFESLDKKVAGRRETAGEYERQLNLQPVKAALASGAVPIRLPLLVDDRDKTLQALKQAGIYVQDVWYDTPVSPERYYAKAKFDEAVCPVATQVAARIMNLPTHSKVRTKDIAHIARVLGGKR